MHFPFKHGDFPASPVSFLGGIYFCHSFSWILRSSKFPFARTPASPMRSIHPKSDLDQWDLAFNEEVGPLALEICVILSDCRVLLPLRIGSRIRFVLSESGILYLQSDQMTDWDGIFGPSILRKSRGVWILRVTTVGLLLKQFKVIYHLLCPISFGLFHLPKKEMWFEYHNKGPKGFQIFFGTSWNWLRFFGPAPPF